MEQEIVIIFDDKNSSKKGNYFENLVNNIFSQQRYEIDGNVNVTGQEFDLICTHMDRSNEKILIECKAKESLASSDLNLFNFKVNDNNFTHGIFIYIKNFEHQAKGTINQWKKDKRYKNLSFWNGAKVIELLIASTQIKEFKFLKDEFQCTKIILFFSYEGFFYVPLFSDTTQPKFFSIYKAKTLEEVTDKNIIELVKKYIKDTKNIDFYEEKQIQNSITNSLKESSYKIIDLFAGIGGTRLGFQNSFKEKAHFVFASEIDKFAQQTYVSNYGHLPSGDITQIEPQEIPKFDILLAGFPCQPFSNARLKKGFDNTRGTLFFDIAQIAKHHKPQVLFLENVKRFINHDKGNTFRVVKETLEELGYRVFAKVLNARDFGVPQNRERIYIIAFLDHTIEFEFPKPLNKSVKLGDILEESINEKYTISDKLWEGLQRHKLESKKKIMGFGYRMFNEESEYTSTITARYYKYGSEILIEQKDKNPRKLSPKEAGRLQGFPDDFKIVVSDTQAYKQFGNSVAVPVIEALAKNILEVLDK